MRRTFILLWEGDILFSYAVAALMLMVVLYGKTRPLLIAIAIVVGLGFIPGLSDIFAVAAGLAAAGLIALYLRSEKRVNIRGRGVPLFSFLLLLIGSLLVVAAAVFWLLPDGPVEPRLPLSVFGPLLLDRGMAIVEVLRAGGKAQCSIGCQHLFVLRDSDHSGRTRSAFRTRSRRRGRHRRAKADE